MRAADWLCLLGAVALIALMAFVAFGQPVQELPWQMSPIPQYSPATSTAGPPLVVLHYRCSSLGNNLFSFEPLEDVRGAKITLTCVNCECGAAK